eukprot:1148103-Pelagomonas_calceolata.AAC.6
MFNKSLYNYTPHKPCAADALEAFQVLEEENHLKQMERKINNAKSTIPAAARGGHLVQCRSRQIDSPAPACMCKGALLGLPACRRAPHPRDNYPCDKIREDKRSPFLLMLLSVVCLANLCGSNSTLFVFRPVSSLLDSAGKPAHPVPVLFQCPSGSSARPHSCMKHAR